VPDIVVPDIVAVYADESCLGNGREGENPGGAGGLVEYRRRARRAAAGAQPNGVIVRHDYWVSEPATTNNRMALRSVIEAFRGLLTKRNPLRVVFTSDSLYLIKGLREWVHGWSRRGWKRKGGALENLALWREAVDVIQASGHECEWRWVRGHAGHPQNEYANYLATRAAASQSSSNGLVGSEFDAWLAARREGRARLRPLAPFPEAREFVASPPMPGRGTAVALPRSRDV
jgi:ribonuclease HI